MLSIYSAFSNITCKLLNHIIIILLIHSMLVFLFLFSLVPGFAFSAEPNNEGEDDQGVSSWDDYQPEETPCPGEKCSKDVDL